MDNKTLDYAKAKQMETKRDASESFLSEKHIIHKMDLVQVDLIRFQAFEADVDRAEYVFRERALY